MPSHVKHVPKHRQSAARTISRRAPRKAVRTTVLLSSLAVAATGVTVGGGALTSSIQDADAGESAATVAADLGSVLRPSEKAAKKSSAAEVKAVLAERGEVVTRSDNREKADPKKLAALAPDDDDNAMTRTEDLSGEDPRTVGRALLAEFGFSDDQFGCLDSLWTRESNWRVNADNPSSSAYGIPQALPGSKMSSYGGDWATNPVTQIRWGLHYIEDRYGSPCGAWGHSQSHGWY